MICQITIVITSPPIVAISAFSLRRGLAGALSAWPTSGFFNGLAPNGSAMKKQNHQQRTYTTTAPAMDMRWSLSCEWFEAIKRAIASIRQQIHQTIRPNRYLSDAANRAFQQPFLGNDLIAIQYQPR